MTLLSDLRPALRSLRRAPAFTLIASLTLALGIGSSVAAWAYLDYLKQPTVEAPRPEQLRFVYQATSADPRGGLSTPDLRDLEASATMRPLAAWRLFSSSMVFPDATRHAWGHAVSGDYFALFGARPALGRLIQPDDDREGAEPVLVLGHRFWEQRLGSDANVVGRSVLLDGRHRYTVVGVAAPRFQGQGFGTAIYLPLGSASWLSGLSNREATSLTVLGRLSAAATESAVRVRLASLARSMDESHPREQSRRFDLVPPREALAWSSDEPLVRGAETLGVAVLVLLFLGAANVATLMLARATTREREWAVRSALGASRGRLARATLIESLAIAALGACAGLPLAALLVNVVEVYLVGTSAVGLGDWSNASHLPIDWSFAAALGATLALGSALLSWGLAAASQGRADLVAPLKAEGESGGASGSLRLGGRRALVMSQAALSTALLVLAVLSARSLGHLGSQELGFPTEDRLLAVIHVPRETTPQVGSPPSRSSLLDDIRGLPGVRRAGVVSRGPLSPLPMKAEVEGAPNHPRVQVTFNNVSDDYLGALGVPLLAGRDFRPEDRAEAPRVAIISRQLAQALWPGANALGQRLRLLPPGAAQALELEVTGIAADSRQGPLRDAVAPHVFLPRGLSTESRPTFVVHASAPIAESLGRVLRERHPDAALIDLQPLDEQRRRSAAEGRMNAEIAAGMGGLGLSLAAVGLFGLVSFSVSRRFREFGIRMAIGARGADLVRDVMADSWRLLAVGVGVGLVLAYPIARVAESRLIGVSASDPLSYALAAMLLLSAGLLAAWAPARRAAAGEPLAALRRP